jgi:hypothetical protein
MSRGVVRNPSGYVSAGRTAADKATKFAETIKEYGWTGKWSTDEDSGVTHLFARREDETIDIWWLGDGLDLDHLPVYTLAGERIQLKNVSGAVKIAAGQPEPGRLVKAVKKQRRQLTGHLPFNGDTPDDEIEHMLFGKCITWVNSVSGSTDSAIVGGRKTVRVVRNGKAWIEFIDGNGFHAVYLNAIVAVS